MKKIFFAAILLQLFTTVSYSQVVYSQADTSLLKAQIQKYQQSLEYADTVLASYLWAHSPEISFIHPRGHQHGWQEINEGIYKFFAETFSKRSFKIHNEKISVYDDFAWVEFYWVFDATFRKNNSLLQTKGRETQVWRRIDKEWNLVHVHYSNMPIFTAGKGF